jgi:CRISPR/Cas system CSM-associated protein Csm2 small subunit
MHTQIHTNPRRSIRDVYEQVTQKIKEIMQTPLKPVEVPEAVLDRAIAEVRGSDKRTIEKWKSIFEKSGLIKFIGGAKPNRIAELL